VLPLEIATAMEDYFDPAYFSGFHYCFAILVPPKYGQTKDAALPRSYVPNGNTSFLIKA
jgi:hypothetical protein